MKLQGWVLALMGPGSSHDRQGMACLRGSDSLLSALHCLAERAPAQTQRLQQSCAHSWRAG